MITFGQNIKSRGVVGLRKLSYLILVILFCLSGTRFSFADELDDTVKEKEQKEQQANQTEEQLVQAKQYEGSLASQLSQMSNDLYTAQANYAAAEIEVAEKEQEIAQNEESIKQKEADIEYQTGLVSARIRNLYKNSQFSPLISLFLSSNFNELNAEYVYRVNILRQDKEVIKGLQNRIALLNTEREKLQTEKTQFELDKIALENQKKQLEAQEAYINSQIASVQQLQSQLSGQLTGLQNEISNLSAKEQQILAAKAAAAAASTSVGNEEQNTGSIEQTTPQGQSGDYYSFWSYGFPHRVGMNQYGAYGRALAGQNVGQILHAYFANVTIAGIDSGTSTYPIPNQIKVQGYGWIDFENLYLKGIGEMPSSWSMEAIKAQAIASRTYALAYIGYSNYANYDQYRNDPNAKEICTNQACQVFIGQVKDERWAQAVDETRGMVITNGGVPIMAYYASTAGGATLSTEEVWGGYRSYALGMIDTDNNGKPFDGPDWGASPWYHKCWGDNSWLTKDQVADLFNAALLPESFNNQLPASPNGFTPDQVKDTLKSQGIAIVEDLKSIEVITGAQRTESLRVYYQNTYVNISPERFRFVYNLRSPGTNALWSSRWDIQSN